ncbi:Radical SAM domain protein [Gloeothece citriformis PCC 7424]|uniref:Radical SAM domain protein n=1 Tax=Gloeothece citriformis (strain PCC 7424) TaxID=65393 RepID=B7KGE4_GLOC7|nr:radical SAM protein [Gloeothece citriformis]ACK70615.1 Radical SAM domain protein [Gloeothece citriformis PCC 7424]
MNIAKGTENIVNPLQESALNKKGLCDYVINIASGCLHGCTFCYVPSTPAIRTRQKQLQTQGVNDPQQDWGKYLFVREEIPEKLEAILSRKQSWRTTEAGRGVTLLCSGTDPYQNQHTASVTRQTVKVLLKYHKRVRILTRGLLWVHDLELLRHPNVTIGMSIPNLDDKFSRQIEPQAPPPSERYKALKKGFKAECRLYIAAAPTPPYMGIEQFKKHLDELMKLDPEVIFWEPINARGTNGKRMLAAGLDFTKSVMNKQSWAEHFIRQWEAIEQAADEIGCKERLHIWPDKELKGYVDLQKLEFWWSRPTVEKWENKPQLKKNISYQEENNFLMNLN